jgi:DNA-binding beta-propeller fold protein YncE
MAIDKAGQFAYVAIWGSHYVSKVDIRSLASGDADDIAKEVREVAQIKMAQGSHPYSVAIHPSGTLLFVANTQSHRLAIVNLSTDAVEHEVDLGSIGARAVTFSADGSTAYVSIENVSELPLSMSRTGQLTRASRRAQGPGDSPSTQAISRSTLRLLTERPRPSSLSQTRSP